MSCKKYEKQGYSEGNSNMDVDMKKILAVIILILLISLFSGCTGQDRTSEIAPLAKVFIKDYIPNAETIQFTNETVIFGGYSPDYWDVYGTGTVIYEGSRQIFTYHIFVQEQGGDLKCILKQLTIGEV